jgi:hypothetical protein
MKTRWVAFFFDLGRQLHLPLSTSEAVLTELSHLVGARFDTRTANERAGKTLNFTKH